MQAAEDHYDAVVIGSGCGGTMTALPLARAVKARGAGERILMLERGTWWTTPVGTVQDKEVKTFSFLEGKGQPVQYWSSAENFRASLTSTRGASDGRGTRTASTTSRRLGARVCSGCATTTA